MADNLTPEEISQLTGGDIENIADVEHPQGGPDEDIEGTGVDTPNIEGAAWDSEIAETDKNNPEWKEINFIELTPEDRELYLNSVEFRERFSEDKKHLLKHKDDIFWEQAKSFFEILKDRTDNINNKSQEALYGLINTKMFGLYQYI